MLSWGSHRILMKIRVFWEMKPCRWGNTFLFSKKIRAFNFSPKWLPSPSSGKKQSTILLIKYRVNHKFLRDFRTRLRPMGPDGLFVSQRTGSHSAGIHVPFTNCFVCRWFCVVHVRNLRCTVTIDSVLANSKTRNAFLFTVNAIFLHNYPLAVEPGSTPRPLVQKKLGEVPTYWYAPFCRVCLGCCAVEFGNPGGTYE